MTAARKSKPAYMASSPWHVKNCLAVGYVSTDKPSAQPQAPVFHTAAVDCAVMASAVVHTCNVTELDSPKSP